MDTNNNNWVNDITEKISKVGEKIVDTTKDIAEISKLKLEERNHKSNMKATKLKMAERYLKVYANKETDREMVALMEELKIHQRRLEKVEERLETLIGDLKNRKSTDSYTTVKGEPFSQSEHFEPEDEDDAEEQVLVKCPHCNSMVPVEFMYCNVCGQELKN